MRSGRAGRTLSALRGINLLVRINPAMPTRVGAVVAKHVQRAIAADYTHPTMGEAARQTRTAHASYTSPVISLRTSKNKETGTHSGLGLA